MSASDSYVSNLFADALAAPAGQRQVISRELFRSLAVIGETFTDFVLVAIWAFAVYSLQLHLGYRGGYPTQKVAIASAVIGLSAARSLQEIQEDRASCALVSIRETEQIIRTTILCQILLLLLGLVLGLSFSPAVSLLSLVAMPVSLLAEKRLFTSTLRTLHARGYGVHRVVVYGAADTGTRVALALTYSPRRGLYPVAVIRDDALSTIHSLFRLHDRRTRKIPENRGPLTVATLRSLDCHLLIVAAPHLSPVRIAEIAQTAEEARSSIAILHDPAMRSRRATECIDIDGMAVLSNMPPITALHSAFLKRISDVLLASTILLLLAPLFLLITVLIRADSPGPALFVQKRVGRSGELFNIFKFRSMHVSAPKYERSPIESSDPRITRIGRILRRASLDELPQLINVLLGSMSLVGPRPEMPFLVERHNIVHRPRLQVNPGITGLWQLSADRAFPIHQNTQYDLYYIRNRTLCMDLAILLHTALFAMRGGV